MVVHAAKPLNLKDMRSVQRLSCKRVKPQAIGGRKGLPLTGNAEGEEIVYARWETKWLLSWENSIYEVAFISKLYKTYKKF